jgi:hypothetical protein
VLWPQRALGFLIGQPLTFARLIYHALNSSVRQLAT